MSKILYLFAFVALVQVATGLDCYSCHPCVIGQNYRKVLSCGKYVFSESGGGCLKQTYINNYDKKEVTERYCVVGTKNADGVVEHKCTEAKGNNTFCELCFTSFCNSGSFLQISLVSLFASYIILKLV